MATLNSNVKGTTDGVSDWIDTDLGTAVINRFLNAAYYRSKDLDLSDCGGDDALAEIQNLLAAHFIAIGRERQTQKESVAGEASVTFAGRTDMGLRSTTYGQTALDMDCTGELAKAGLKKASFRVWDHDDIDYDADTDSEDWT